MIIRTRNPALMRVAAMLAVLLCAGLYVSQTATAAKSDADVTVYITKTGTKYHKADCRSLRKSKIKITLKEAKERGYTQCHICYPPASTENYVPQNGDYCPVPRTVEGRIMRRADVLREFKRLTGHPHGWPGHIIDHIVPLYKGGKDELSNMQWQTVEEARAKDQVE